eukprot:703745-Prymnesium_polylepis.1
MTTAMLLRRRLRYDGAASVCQTCQRVRRRTHRAPGACTHRGGCELCACACALLSGMWSTRAAGRVPAAGQAGGGENSDHGGGRGGALQDVRALPPAAAPPFLWGP